MGTACLIRAPTQSAWNASAYVEALTCGPMVNMLATHAVLCGASFRGPANE